MTGYNPIIFKAYRKLAFAVLKEYERELLDEKEKLERAEKKLQKTDITEKATFKRNKAVVTWTKTRIEILEDWKKSKWAEFYFDLVTADFSNRALNSMGEKIN